MFVCDLFDVKKSVPDGKTIHISNMIDVERLDGKDVILCQYDYKGNLQYRPITVNKNAIIDSNKTYAGTA